MTKPKIEYKVTLSKTFSYPRPMLCKGEEKFDAQEKAYHDMYVTLDEIVNKNHEELDIRKLFEVSCVEDKVFKFRKPTEPANLVDLQQIITYLAQQDLEKKFGTLNIEENPDAFISEGDQWYLKENIEQEFYKLKGKYEKLLRYFEPDKPKETYRAPRAGSNLRSGTIQREGSPRVELSSGIWASSIPRTQEVPISSAGRFTTTLDSLWTPESIVRPSASFTPIGTTISNPGGGRLMWTGENWVATE